MTFHDIYKSVFDSICAEDQERIRGLVDENDISLAYGDKIPEKPDMDEVLERVIINGMFPDVLERGDIYDTNLLDEKVPEEIVASVEAVIEQTLAVMSNMLDIREWVNRNDDLA